MEGDRKVTVEQGKDFASQYGMKFFEISAKESTNVSEVFIEMTKEIIKNTNKKDPASLKDNAFVSSASTGKSVNSGKGCCYLKRKCESLKLYHYPINKVKRIFLNIQFLNI